MTSNVRFTYVCILLIFSGTLESSYHSSFHVCPGDQFSLNCLTNGSFLEFNVTTKDYIGLRLISSIGVQEIQPLIAGYTIFRFSRESNTPLNITLSITNVTDDLLVSCVEFPPLDEQQMLLITKYNIDVVYLSPPKVIVREHLFEENVSLTLLLNDSSIEEYAPNLSYSTSFLIVPPAAISANDENATLTLTYNIKYSVTVFGYLDQCEYYNGTSTTLTFFYVNCGSPSPPENGYVHPNVSTLEGAETNITCSGLQDGENHTVQIRCGHDGKWQPNLSDTCAQPPESYPSELIAIIIPVTIILAVNIIIAIILLLCVWRRLKLSRTARWRASGRYHAGEDTIALSEDEGSSTN